LQNGSKRRKYLQLTRILMVCLGNICRSPLAEGALRYHAAQSVHEVLVDSAGTGDWHIGHAPDPRAQEVARRLGRIDIAGLRARQVVVHDFYQFDHIIAMDDSNLANLRKLAPADATARLSLLLDYLPGREGQSVVDPYYGDVADFETCWRDVDMASTALLATLA
jgi:protein-tyrosine phosphatase